MTKDDLIEALAKAMYEGAGYDSPWSQQYTWRQTYYRAKALSVMPGVVEFVGRYMAEWDDDACQVMADMWREQMA